MHLYLNHNGKIVRSDKALITADNRGFRYGDGLFETMKMIDGNIALSNYHFDRLFKGLALLGFEKPAYFTPPYLLEQINTLTESNHHRKFARIRLTVYRGEGGIYDLNNHFPNFIIQSWKLNDFLPGFNENGLTLGIYNDARKNADKFSECKHNNFLPYFMAAMEAKKNHWNDALLLNGNDRICDTTIANIFIIKNGEIFTPAILEGCIAGTMRRYLIEKLSAFQPIHETTIPINTLQEADEVFVTNAIYGIRWVKQVGDTSYICKQSKEIYCQHIQNLWQIS